MSDSEAILIRERVPLAMESCDRTSREDFPILRAYFLHCQRSPVFADAVFAYTRAMYCWDVSAVEGDALPTVLDRFKTHLKLGGKELMGEGVFEREYQGLEPKAKREVRKTLDNREDREKTKLHDPLWPPMDKAILVLWFPCLLWLMDDNSAALLLRGFEIVLDGKRQQPFAGLNADAYKKARQRLQKKGLKYWRDYYTTPPCEFEGGKALLKFPRQQQPPGFDYAIDRA